MIHMDIVSLAWAGCFNGSLYILPFTRRMGKKWTLGVLLIESSNCINCLLDRSANR